MWMKGQHLSVLELKVGRYCGFSLAAGALDSRAAPGLVKACTERSFQGCKWAASDDENLRATFTFIQGQLEWPQLRLRPWSTLTSADWPGATTSPDYCLRSSVPKVLNSSHHSNPCCRAPLRPQNALQGSPFEIIYILWSGGFVSLSLMTVST